MPDEITAEQVGAASFKAHVSALKTRYGSWQLVLDIYESENTAVLKLVGMVDKTVSVALVLEPEEE